MKDIWDMRSIIANSVEQRVFEPKDKELWDKAYETFLGIKS